MKCPKCGNEIADDSMFCEYCGEQIGKSEYKVHVKWLLYVAMIFTCILNYFIMEVQTYEAVIVGFCLLIIQLCVFIPASVLFYKKRITYPIFVLALLLFIANVLIFVDASMFDGYIHWDDGFKADATIYGDANHLSCGFIWINPITILLYIAYEYYSLRKCRNHNNKS